MNALRLLPPDALRPRWSTPNALLYIGALVLLVATLAFVTILGDEHGNAALVGFSVIAAAGSLALTYVFESRGQAVAAGVLATVTVLLFALFVGSLANLVGIIDFEVEGDDYQPGLLVVEVLTIAAALAALQRFRAPLLVLPAATVFWAAVADLGSVFAWDDAEEALSLAVGIALMAAGVVVDGAGRRPYGFWLHLVGGLASGGALLALVDSDAAWGIVALVSLGYVGAAYRLSRSSYAVFGAIGIVATTAYFSTDGFGVFAGFPFGEPADPGVEPWQVALWFVAAGLVIIALGLLGERLPQSPPDDGGGETP